MKKISSDALYCDKIVDIFNSTKHVIIFYIYIHTHKSAGWCCIYNIRVIHKIICTEDSFGCGYTPGESIPRGELCKTLTLYNTYTIRTHYHDRGVRVVHGVVIGDVAWMTEGARDAAEKFSCRGTPVAGRRDRVRSTNYTVRTVVVDEEGGERNVYVCLAWRVKRR